ncbi:Uncharacterised protein [Segatella copri]|nr:Uncharacterised protein [Segatella copri]
MLGRILATNGFRIPDAVWSENKIIRVMTTIVLITTLTGKFFSSTKIKLA